MTLDDATRRLAEAGVDNPRGDARLLLAHESRTVGAVMTDQIAFADFLKKETVRVTDVLKSVGLVKS